MSMVTRGKCLEREDDARDDERSDDTGGNSEFISNQLKERCLAMGKNQKRFNVNSKGDGAGSEARTGVWAWRLTPVAVVAAAVLLLLPVGKAWAQVDACGAPSSEGEVICDPSEVGSGVRYWEAHGSAGPITLKIPGVSASSTAIPSINVPLNQVFSSPVAINHNDDLTIEIGTEGMVAITQSEVAPAHGMVVRSQNAGADAVIKVDVRSGVKIGTQTARMLEHGLWVTIWSTGTNTADHSVSSGATIYAMKDGLSVESDGSGKMSVINTGDVTAGNRGFRLVNSGAVELTNSGVIVSGSATAMAAHGIHLEKYRTGDVTLTNSGAITAKGRSTHGIFLNARFAESGETTVTNSGVITAPEFGIHVHQGGTGDTTVTNSGAITGSVHGIYVRRDGVSDITVETSGDITSSVYGIFVDLNGDGGDGNNARTSDIDVTVAEGSTVTGGNGGIYVRTSALGENDVVKPTVTVHGTVTGGKDAMDAAVTLVPGGMITVGRTGHVKAGESGVAIVSGLAPPANPPMDYEPKMSDLDVMVAGMVTGDIRVRDAGALTLAVPEGGTVTGTAYDPVGPFTVAGSIGRLLYTDGGTVTIGQTGRITGVDGETAAIQSEAGDLYVTVAGTVTGDIRTMNAGDLTLTVPEGGTVTGTAYDPVGSLTVAGSVGRLMYTDGGKVTVAQTGRITGVDGETAAIQSEAGDLDVTVAGTVMGNIRGMGTGEHMVNVLRGGMVTGTIHLDGSTVTNAGTIRGEAYGVRVGAGSTVTNSGTIEAKIPIEAGAGSTVTNSGMVRSTDGREGVAIRISKGANTLTLRPGMTVVGKIQGLSGQDDTIDLSNLAGVEVGVLTFVDEEDKPVNLANIGRLVRPRGGIGHGICGGNSCVGLDTTAFALADDMLSDLTGSIHGAVVDRGMRPGRDDSGRTTVWATPFGGARNQNAAGSVADGTHFFGGGIVGTGWSTLTLRVGGFLGGSVGMIDVDSMQDPDVDVQTIFGGLYAQRAVGDVIYDARLLMGRMTQDSTRRVFSDTIEVEYHSFFFSPEVGMATTLRLTDTLDMLPRVRVRYAGLFTNGFRESGEMSDWDVQFQDRTVHVVEGRAEVGLPFALDNGGRINPRVGVEGRWLLSGSEIRGAVGGKSFRPIDAGGDDQVVTGLAGVEVSLPVADATTLVGSFDGALTTEDAWRALGYLGLSYSF